MGPICTQSQHRAAPDTVPEQPDLMNISSALSYALVAHGDRKTPFASTRDMVKLFLVSGPLYLSHTHTHTHTCSSGV